MNEENTRIAIYSCPDPESEVFSILSSIQGYNPFTKEVLEPDPVIKPYIGPTNKFGPHVTLRGVFSVSKYQEMKESLLGAISDLEVFDYCFSDCIPLDRSHLFANTHPTPALILAVDDSSKDKFTEVHKKMLESTNRFRNEVEEVWKSELFRSNEQLWNHILQYGSPYSMDNYIPHLSLATAMTDDKELWQKIQHHIKKTYPVLFQTQIRFNKIYIFEEIMEGSIQGSFRIKEEIDIK